MSTTPPTPPHGLDPSLLSMISAYKSQSGRPTWSGPLDADPYLPQLPDEWPWPEDHLSWSEVRERLLRLWDSDVPELQMGRLAQRSERIGMQGWFGHRLGEGAGPDGRRYAPELYAATFAWIQAEEAFKARRAANRAVLVSAIAVVVAVAGVVVAAISH